MESVGKCPAILWQDSDRFEIGITTRHGHRGNEHPLLRVRQFLAPTVFDCQSLGAGLRNVVAENH